MLGVSADDKHCVAPSMVRWLSAVDSTIVELACTGLAHKWPEQPSLASVGSGMAAGAPRPRAHLERPTLGSIFYSHNEPGLSELCITVLFTVACLCIDHWMVTDFTEGAARSSGECSAEKFFVL